MKSIQLSSVSPSHIISLPVTTDWDGDPVRAAKAFGHVKALNKEPSDTVSSSVPVNEKLDEQIEID